MEHVAVMRWYAQEKRVPPLITSVWLETPPNQVRELLKENSLIEDQWSPQSPTPSVTIHRMLRGCSRNFLDAT